MAQGFGFVVAVRKRRNTLRISSLRADATEPKNKPATHQVLCVEVLAKLIVSVTRAGQRPRAQPATTDARAARATVWAGPARLRANNSLSAMRQGPTRRYGGAEHGGKTQATYTRC
jgi:hypothetical protein